MKTKKIHYTVIFPIIQNQGRWKTVSHPAELRARRHKNLLELSWSLE